MKITIPAKIREELASIANVWVDFDDSRILSPAQNAKTIRAPKEHIAIYDWLDISDEHYNNCTYIKYRVVYNDGTEEIIRFENKQIAEYSLQPPSVDLNGFKEACLSDSAAWLETYKAETVDYSFARYFNREYCLSEYDHCFQQNVKIPATGLLELADGIVSCRGLVYSDCMDTRYMENTRFGSFEFLKNDPFEFELYKNAFFQNRCTGAIKYLRGSCLNLYSLFSNNNICHALLDVASSLGILNEHYDDFGLFDWYIVPSGSFGLSVDMLTRVGIPQTKILYVGAIRTAESFNCHIEGFLFDRLVVPGFNGIGRFYKKNAFDFLRHLYTPELSSVKKIKKRKIYLSREYAGRNISNEKDLMSLLKAYGFETLYASTQLDVPALMAQSDIVIGAHGASMANCVFCSPQATLIDLLPEYYPQPFFRSLCAAVELNYIGIICRRSNQEKEVTHRSPHSKSSFFVDIPQLKKVLDSLL